MDRRVVIIATTGVALALALGAAILLLKPFGPDDPTCPGDEGHFNLLTADVEGAMGALRALPEINGEEIGLMGASQAGWIAPRAAVEKAAAFLALASAPTVGERVANLYERLSSGAEGQLSRDEIADRLRKSEIGFDPKPYSSASMCQSSGCSAPRTIARRWTKARRSSIV